MVYWFFIGFDNRDSVIKEMKKAGVTISFDKKLKTYKSRVYFDAELINVEANEASNYSEQIKLCIAKGYTPVLLGLKVDIELPADRCIVIGSKNSKEMIHLLRLLLSRSKKIKKG